MACRPSTLASLIHPRVTYVTRSPSVYVTPVEFVLARVKARLMKTLLYICTVKKVMDRTLASRPCTWVPPKHLRVNNHRLGASSETS